VKPRLLLNLPRLPWLALLAAVLVSGGARASSTCYDDRDYPAVADLQPTPAGYRIVLSGIFIDKQGSAPVLELSPAGGWRTAGRVACREGGDFSRCVRETQGCEIKLPEIPLSKEEATRILGRDVQDVEQRVNACVAQGGYVYFGIGFYRGEGTTGVGGVGRYDPRTGKMEIRRPAKLRETSVTHLAHDGTSLWIGTGNLHECIGMVPTEGLLRYDWQRDSVEVHPAGSGMCGFMVRGILIRDGAVVVATDTGLAVLDKGPGTQSWRHLVPDLQASGLMRQTTCDALYERLLRSVSREEDCCGWSAYSQLHDTLKSRYPAVLEKFERARFKPEAGGQRK